MSRFQDDNYETRRVSHDLIVWRRYLCCTITRSVKLPVKMVPLQSADPVSWTKPLDEWRSWPMTRMVNSKANHLVGEHARSMTLFFWKVRISGNRPDFTKVFLENLANAENQIWALSPRTVSRGANGDFAITRLPIWRSAAQNFRRRDSFRDRPGDRSQQTDVQNCGDDDRNDQYLTRISSAWDLECLFQRSLKKFKSGAANCCEPAVPLSLCNLSIPTRAAR